jgi:hypothetical protein
LLLPSPWPGFTKFANLSSLAKIYVQDLVWDLRDTLTKLILEKRAYIYICGDAKHMAKSVEEMLMQMLGEAKGGSAEVEGAKEFKLLKERNVGITFFPCVSGRDLTVFCLFARTATSLGCVVIVYSL